MDFFEHDLDPKLDAVGGSDIPPYVEDPGAFDAVELTFAWLVSGPNPVMVDGRAIAGLPRRDIPLDELATVLDRHCPAATSDAVWTHLITHFRDDAQRWTVPCAGLAMPALRAIAAALTRWYSGELHDINSAVLVGFLTGLRQTNIDDPGIFTRLRWAAYRGGHVALRDALLSPVPDGELGFDTAPPPRLPAHPDLALLTAVEAGAITADEAVLIAATRFGDLSLAEAAHARGQTPTSAAETRRDAEERLAAHLTNTSTPRLDNPAPAQLDTHRAEGQPGVGGSTPRPRRSPPVPRVRRRSVTRRGPAQDQKHHHPDSPHSTSAETRDTGARLSPSPRSPRPGVLSDSVEEASSCD